MGEIVVGVDGSDGSRAALAWAVDEAALRADGVVAVTVVPPVLPTYAEAVLDGESRGRVARETERVAAEQLDEMVASHRQTGVKITTLTVSGPDVAEMLVNRAAAASALVVGSRGHSGVRRLLLGSVSQQAVVHARGTTVVVPTDTPQHERDPKVIVGIDDSPGAMAALRRAAEEARLREIELELLMVQPPPPAAGVRSPVTSYIWTGLEATAAQDADLQRRHEQVVAHWRNEGEARLQNMLHELDPSLRPAEARCEVVAAPHTARALLDAAEWAQLLVVGTRGLGGFSGMLLGSVSQQCVRHATSPTMVVPADVD